MFGSTQANNNQGGSSLFGGPPANQGGLFNSSVQVNNPQTQQQPTTLFGRVQQPQQTGGLFGSSILGNNQQNQQQQTGFGQQNQAQQGTGLFGQNQPNQQPSGLFNNSSTAQAPLFQNSTQQQNSGQPQLGQPNASMLWQPGSGLSLREKTVPEQMAAILEQWDTGSPNCAFKHYFYNKVLDEHAPFYRPGPNEDPKKWEEALSKKPGPGYVPVLCTGFTQMGDRIKTQQQNLALFNKRLHEINNSLSLMLQNHDTKTSIRAMDAKRKHVVLKQRCLALATKVQVLRNRGYALGGDEEDLRTKLVALEKAVSDPGISARAEEIWARMITVQERARLLKADIEKSGTQSMTGLDESTEKQAKKILEDYQTQLVHLKKELDKIQKDYVEWEKEQPTPPTPKSRG